MGSIRKAAARQFCACWYLYSVVVLLVSVKFSSATYNPAYHPQQAHYGHPTYGAQGQSEEQHPHQQRQQQQQQPVQWNGELPRGGSTMVAPEPTEYQYEEDRFEPPKIHLKHMSMALRLTSEWNRRLLDGVNHRFQRVWGKPNVKPQPVRQEQPQHPHQQGYGGHPVNINPSRSWHPPIPEGPAQIENELTLFHAKAPRESDGKECRGVARWGPELLPYLEHVVQLLGVSDGAEIPLAMIYLDRACSVETPRSNGVPSCPFCTPRTVHRLSLAALILAKQAIDGAYNIDFYFEKLSSLGIPLTQLQQMVDWMRGALGDPGSLVTVVQMKTWSQTWDSMFYPQHQRQRRLEASRQQHVAQAPPPRRMMEAPQYQPHSQIQATHPYEQ